VPALVNVCENVQADDDALPLRNEPSFAATLWKPPGVFVQVTVSPT